MSDGGRRDKANARFVTRKRLFYFIVSDRILIHYDPADWSSARAGGRLPPVPAAVPKGNKTWLDPV